MTEILLKHGLGGVKKYKMLPISYVGITRILKRGHRGRDRTELDLQRPMQSLSITTNVVSSKPVQTRCTR
jgi:hypothetical protein